MNGKLINSYENDFYKIVSSSIDKKQKDELEKKSFSDLLIERSLLQRTFMKRTRILELFHQQQQYIKNKNFINSIYQIVDQEERDSLENNLRIQEILINSCSSSMDVHYTSDIKNNEDFDRIFKVFDKINELAMPYLENDAVQEIVIRSNHALHFKSLRMMNFYLKLLQNMDKQKSFQFESSNISEIHPIKIMSSKSKRENLYHDISILKLSIEELDHIFISILPSSIHLPQ